MKRSSKHKIAETVVGAAIGAAIAGPAGAVAGGLAGHQVAAHTPHPEANKRAVKPGNRDSGDALVHAALKRILVPVDFSLPSHNALRFAGDWAARFGSEICLLHVIESTSTITTAGAEPVAPMLPPADFREQARAQLERLAREEFPSSMNVSTELREGVPHDEIVTAAQQWRADLIIIATHGRTGLAHALLGSTAERVVRHAGCPVLTLRRVATDQS